MTARLATAWRPVDLHRRLELGDTVLGHGLDRYLVTDIGLDFRQRVDEVLTGEADGVAVLANSSRSPDPMYIIFGILRQIIIKYMAHIGDV